MTKDWIRTHLSDPYVKQSQQDGYLSRAAYKLLALDDKDHLFKQGMTVVDLGAAPGGWSQVASERIGRQGHVIALDCLEMAPLPGVTFIQGDFREQSILDVLQSELNGAPVNVVISDMAPNLSGNKTIDQPRSMYLVELAWDFAQQALAEGGDFVCKMFQGAGVDTFIRDIRPHFKVVKSRKPDASRPRSREFYLSCKGFLGYTG